MKRSKRLVKIRNSKPKQAPEYLRNEAENMVRNGLNTSFLGFDPNFPAGVQLSQVDTLFNNNRWYMVSNMRQLLSEIYVEHGIVQTIVDVPVDDGFRGGVMIQSDQLGEDNVKTLSESLDRDDDLTQMAQAVKWNRLYGGAGVIVMTDQDPSLPLDVSAIRSDSPLEFRAVDLWELFWDKQNTEGYDTALQEEKFEHYSYYGTKVHKSRVMRMKGLTAPSFVRPRLRGWGFSVVEALVRSINQYLKSNNLSFEVLDEFKIDVYKIKNYTNTLLSPQGQQAVQSRVQMANQQKNFLNAITMDSEDDYLQKQLTFSGLAETMVGIRMQIASDMRMPLTKVFGISATGFNSGQDDIENYNAMVEAQVRTKVKYHILRLLELKCQKLFGYIPDDLTIEFKPLRVLSAEQEENVKTQKFNRLIQAKTANEISALEFRHAINKENLLGIQLDTDQSALEELDDVGADTAEESDSKGAPGANKPDTQKSKAPKSTAEPKEAKEAEEPKPAKNSIEFDIAGYKADRAEETYGLRERKMLYENPGNVDEALWTKAKEASQKAFGKEKWQFVTWWYKKHGGVFK